MKYEIYQLDLTKEDIQKSGKIYHSWDWLIKKGNGFNFKEYDQVYDGNVENDDPYEILKYLFTEFNIHHPLGFHGHSLSVSDVVILDDKMYYCDPLGWKEIV